MRTAALPPRRPRTLRPSHPRSRLPALVAAALTTAACGGTSGHPTTTSATPVTAAAEAAPPRPDPLAEIPRIVAAAEAQGYAWAWMEALCEGIGHRLSGSPQLERAVEWTAAELAAIPGVTVTRQPVEVPVWIRGEESLSLVRPRRAPLAMVGLGGSAGTGGRPLTGDVVVIRSFDELEARADEVRGKVVLFHVEMPPYDAEAVKVGYGAVVGYRVRGPARAGALGAKAVLLRSITTDPTSPPHTGMTRYDDGGPRIPAAAITLPDADRLAAWVDAGERVTVTLRMEARDAGTATSHNVIAELPGRELPGEIVAIGGHLDAWDVGQGAHDDASGVVTSMAALRLLVELGLRPRRTLRVVAWTNEENGLGGARAYADAHGPGHVAAVESDIGAAPVIGLNVGADEDQEATAVAQMARVADALSPLGVRFARPGGAGADVSPLRDLGVPGVGLLHDPAHYFDLHHTAADTLDAVDPAAIRQGTAVMAAVAWALAEMDPALGVAED